MRGRDHGRGCWEAVGDVDIFFSSTDGSNIIILEYVKNNAIVGNTGDLDNTIDIAGLED